MKKARKRRVRSKQKPKQKTGIGSQKPAYIVRPAPLPPGPFALLRDSPGK